MTHETKDCEVLIIGAGFSGLYLLMKLRDLGFQVHLVEAAPGIGGVWHWNCYPGARVDTHCDIYQFSDPELWQDWEWSERFPGWAEMRAYFEHVDRKRSLSKDISYSTRITAATFDKAQHRWTVNADTGVEFRAQYVVPCLGFAAKPYTPQIPGQSTFAGEAHHTAWWPQEDLDFTGKKVGIIGTGASGIQVAQEAARQAERCVVFQRTPNMYLPMGQCRFNSDDNDQRKREWPHRFERRKDTFGGFDFGFIDESGLDVSERKREETYERLWEAGGFNYWLGTYGDVFTNLQTNATAVDFWRRKVRSRIRDPKVAEILAPETAPHPFGVKRPSLEQWFFDLFNYDNVDLVCLKRNPITEITANGVRTKDEFYDLDIIAYATGFDAVTGGITSIDIKDAAGQTIREKWSRGVRTQLGIATAGYPSLLFSYGPQSPTGFCNGPSSAEYQGDCLVELLTYLRDKNICEIEADPAAEEAWRTEVLELADATLFPMADSWYMGANVPGKPREMLMYPGGLPKYLEAFERSRDSGYAGFTLK